MKRDMDLIRQILLVCEADPHGYAPMPLVVEGYSDEQVGFHVHLMMEAGLVDGSDHTHMGCDSPQAIAQKITWQGYEFLEASKNDGLWMQAKNAAAATGSMTIDVLKGVLTGLALAAAKKTAGLP